MRNFITKKLEQFELSYQKSIFAHRLKGLSLLNKLGEMFIYTSEKVYLFSKYCYVRAILFTKYVYGKRRTKYFMSNLLDDFEREHNILFSLIEFKETDKRWQEYMVQKNKICILIRAKRRFTKIVNKNNIEIKELLSEYINQKRFEREYKYSIN